MTLQGFFVLAMIFIVLGAGVAVITANGEWKGGCAGNCARCHQPCADPEKTLAKKKAGHQGK